jgi:YidC/Oxa1 family membrane protein insertase
VTLFASFLDPFVAGLWWVMQYLDLVVHNLGVALVLLALLIRAVFWQLNVKQFRSMLDMQRVAPKLKKLQEKYKGDAQRLQQEQMALYREAGVNPLSGCLPLLVQIPILWSVYWVIALNATLRGKNGTPNYLAGTGTGGACHVHATTWFSTFPLHEQLHPLCFNTQPFLWIGSVLALHAPKLFGIGTLAPNLAAPDLLLILLYAASMYFSVRYGSVPSTDPQQAQMQRVMALISPLMIGYFAWRSSWPSAMVLYWFSYNLFTMAQQIYMLRKYHQPLSILDSEHVVTDEGLAKTALAARGDGAVKSSAASGPDGGDGQANAQESTRRRRRRRKRKR